MTQKKHAHPTQSIWTQQPLSAWDDVARAMEWGNMLDVLSYTPIEYRSMSKAEETIPSTHPNKTTILLHGVIEYTHQSNFRLEFRLHLNNQQTLFCRFPKFAIANHEQWPNGQHVVLEARPLKSTFKDNEHIGDRWVCMYPRKINITLTGQVQPIYKGKNGITPDNLEQCIKDHCHAIGSHAQSSIAVQSIINIHCPPSITQAETSRRFLAEKEIQKVRNNIALHQDIIDEKINISPDSIEQAIEATKLTPTACQRKTITKIATALAQSGERRHLLAADVSTGKTYVSSVISALVISALENKIKGVAVLAPTSILANQLFDEFKRFFPKLQVALHPRDKSENAHVIIGTTGLKGCFKETKPKLLIIDEEHRFGVADREALTSESTFILSMTATPIPRSIGLLLAGGVVMHNLKTTPKPRKVTTTLLGGNDGRSQCLDAALHHLKNENGKVIIVYPAIESTKMTNIKDAEKYWAKAWPEYGVIHSKTKNANEILEKMRQGEVSLILASTRVETGIDLPNCTMIIIVNAERFGMATLHQLRGRVGRGGLLGTCILLSDNENAQERLNYFCSTNNGFELAEADLKSRGMGSIQGIEQSGHKFRFLDLQKDFDLL